MRETKPVIKLTSEVEEKLRILVDNYDKEVGGFLTGEMKDGSIVIDGLLMPYQDAGMAHVKVTAEDQVKLRKEYGKDCFRIVGQWHSHNTMSAHFSGIDDTAHEVLLQNRDFFVFIVSAKGDQHQVGIGYGKPVTTIVECTYEVIAEQNEKLVEALLAEVKKKVTVPKTQTFQYFYPHQTFNKHVDDNKMPIKDWKDYGKNEELDQAAEEALWGDY